MTGLQKLISQSGASFALLLMSALLFFGGGLGAGAARAEMVLNRGNMGEPDTLDPSKATTTTEQHIVEDTFTGLVTDDAAGRPVPGSAESWEMSADGKTYIFHLRKNLKWSDGTPLKAQDFVYSFRRLVDPKTAAQYAPILYILVNGEKVATGKAALETLGVRAIDDHTLELKLHDPVPYLIQMLTHHSTFPVPPHVVEKYGASWTQPDHIVGNGAYMVVKWRPQSVITLVKNPYFYGAKNVKIDKVNYYPAENLEVALKQFRAGELDVTDSFPSRQLPWMRANMPNDYRIAPWLGIYYYAINSKKYPFTDKRVRLALSMAIERELITDKLLKVGAPPAYGFVPPGIANYGKGGKVFFANWPQEKRMAEAKRLMKEAGFGPDHPLTVTLKYNSDQDHKKIALAVAWSWKKIGVITHFFNVEGKVLYADLAAADFEIARAAWIADFNDPQNFLFLLESSTGPMNYGQYSNPKFDALMAQASTMLDLDKRAKIMEQAEQIALNDAPVIPLYFYVSRNLVSHRVHGWVDNIADNHRSCYLSVDPVSPISDLPKAGAAGGRGR
jgi:oligopeptide transport system substrate-binding protein